MFESFEKASLQSPSDVDAYGQQQMSAAVTIEAIIKKSSHNLVNDPRYDAVNYTCLTKAEVHEGDTVNGHKVVDVVKTKDLYLCYLV